MIRISSGQIFESREKISQLLGGDTQKGIAKSARYRKLILLFTNSEMLYLDHFYPRGSHDNCLFTGIGRLGNQDAPDTNPMYDLNIAVMGHISTGRRLLLFEKQGESYCFRGEYSLKETHQNIQPDEEGTMRRVFVFHITRKCDVFEIEDEIEEAGLVR